MRVSNKHTNIYNCSFKENLLEKYSNQPVLKPVKNDVFIPKVVDASNDSKFSIKEAGKNFAKGIITPIKVMIEHPIMTLSTVATTALMCSLVPVVTPILTVGFGALSVAQLLKGCIVAGKEYLKGNYDNSEKTFEEIAQGTLGVATTLAGVKQNAKIAREAKTMVRLQRTKLPFEIRYDISQNVSKMNFVDASKELLSLFTTKNGRSAIKTQFKPFMIKARVQDILSILQGNAVKSAKITTVEEKAKAFKKTPEGKRIAALSDEQITSEVRQIFNEVFDEIGVPETDRPTLKIIKKEKNLGGSYNQGTHSISFNIESYRAGLFDIEETIRHEASHCQDAMMKARLSDINIREISQKSLADRILSGDSPRVTKWNNGYGMETIEPPKMSMKLRRQFAQFAKENIYNDNFSGFSLRDLQEQRRLIKENSGFAKSKQPIISTSSLSDVMTKLTQLLDDNMDFVQQYSSYDDALYALSDYVLSHKYRYQALLQKSPKSMPLKQVDVAEVQKAVYNKVTQIDGGSRLHEAFGVNVTDDVYSQYAYSHEEVTAETKALRYLIRKLTEKMNLKKQNGTLTLQEETQIAEKIGRLNSKIDVRLKGCEYLEEYTKYLANPEDATLKANVTRLKSELDAINANLPERKFKTIKFLDTATMKYPFNQLSLLDVGTEKDKV